MNKHCITVHLWLHEPVWFTAYTSPEKAEEVWAALQVAFSDCYVTWHNGDQTKSYQPK